MSRPARTFGSGAAVRAWFGSLKGRLSVAIVAGVLAAVAIVALGRGVGAGWPLSSAAGTLVSMVLVLILARGTTSPLRELAAAARRMTEGDYTARVQTSNVTEIAQLEMAFNEMAAELAQVDRFRRDLVANASHELRTPISVLRASLENMVDGVVQPDADRLAVLLGQVDRLGRLTEQLLDLSLLESGTVPVQRTPVPVARVLHRIADALGLRTAGRRLVVEVEGDPVVLGDETRIEQVVTNLAENALRHAPPGSDVTLGATTGDGWVRIVVTDHGPGIPDDQVARVFERFHRLDAARRSADGGAGLGLSIVRWIVDLHGGRIEVHGAPSPPGSPGTPGAGLRGCQMVVLLPAKSTPGTDDGPRRSAGRAFRVGSDRTGGPAGSPG